MWMRAAGPKSQGALLCLHAIGTGLDRGRNKFRGFENCLPDRRRALRADRHQDSSSGDRREPNLHVALPGEISDRCSRWNKACDRREIYRANHNRPGIALGRLHPFHALEGELHVVTQPTVEHFVRALAGFGHEGITGARHAHHRGSHWIENTALRCLGNRHARGVVVGRRVHLVFFHIAVADGDADRVRSSCRDR